jgi:hypothetical protein
MPMQSEGEDAKGRVAHQSARDETGSAGSGGSGGTSDTGAKGEPVPGEGSQQGTMPPSQTDDDQYDQGTVQREP